MNILCIDSTITNRGKSGPLIINRVNKVQFIDKDRIIFSFGSLIYLCFFGLSSTVLWATWHSPLTNMYFVINESELEWL